MRFLSISKSRPRNWIIITVAILMQIPGDKRQVISVHGGHGHCRWGLSAIQTILFWHLIFRLGVYITYTMQKLQHEHLAVDCQAFQLVSFLLWNCKIKACSCAQVGGNHIKIFFIFENAMKKSMLFNLLFIYLLFSKIAVPWVALRVNDHELCFNLRKRTPPLHHRLIESNKIVAVPHELTCP